MRFPGWRHTVSHSILLLTFGEERWGPHSVCVAQRILSWCFHSALLPNWQILIQSTYQVAVLINRCSSQHCSHQAHEENEGGVTWLIERDLDFQRRQLPAEEWPWTLCPGPTQVPGERRESVSQAHRPRGITQGGVRHSYSLPSRSLRVSREDRFSLELQM